MWDLIIDGDFLYLEINGDFNFSICICSEYHPLTIFNCRFLILYHQPDCWIVRKTLKNQACVWDFDHLSTLVWDHWLRDLLSAHYLNQSVNQLDQFNSRTLLGSSKFGSKTLDQSFVPECEYPVDDSAVESLLYGYPTKSLE